LVLEAIQRPEVEVVGPPYLRMEEELPPLDEAGWKVISEELRPCFFLCTSKNYFFSIPFFDPLFIGSTLRFILL
jgi:hypothetical protein